MTTEQQNKAWACLPKEARDRIKNNGEFFDIYAQCILEEIYGKHNLTSDTEPEEMLYISRETVIEKYAEIFCNKAPYLDDSPEALLCQACLKVLESLFGDKCRPDKTPEEKAKEIVDTIKEVLTAENVNESVIAQPKTLNVGDKVKIILCTHPEYRDKVGIITSIDSCGNPYVKVDGLGTLFHAPYALEPYNVSANEAKEEAKDNMKMEEKETKNYPPYLDYPLVPTKKEKELNLCELLKDCEGETFYCSLIDKDVVLMQTLATGTIEVSFGNSTLRLHDGRDEEGNLLLFPSKENRNWMEWKDARKPNRWRAEKGECFYMILPGCVVGSLRDNHLDYCSELYNIGNYFRTQEEAEQAAKLVKETLLKFHENKLK